MRIGIYGYGNLGRGVECAVKQNPDVELVGIFTRRQPENIKAATGAAVYHASRIMDFKEEIEVLVICGGSATDLPEMTPALARHFNVVDSFDTHVRIAEHFARVDSAATEGDRVAVISAGWDPGLFSVVRAYAASVLPHGTNYTFWGRGVSQGHSDALRRIDGVLDARQYTVPIRESVSAVRSGKEPMLTAREQHLRECYVVAEDGADLDKIEREIKAMEGYFSEYDTTVTFISDEELRRDHSDLPHAGEVIRCGRTGGADENRHTLEFLLRLDSNPEFTGSVLICVARAVKRMAKEGVVGCKTMLDIPPAYYCATPPDELRTALL